MEKKNKTPEIRFNAFADPWEEGKLGEMLRDLQNTTLSRADLSSESNRPKNVHYGDVLVKFGEILDVKKELLPTIVDEALVAKLRNSCLENGDIVMADTAEDATVGKCSELAGINDEQVFAGLHTVPYRPLLDFAPTYLGYYLNSNAYREQLLPLMQGIKVTSISKSALRDTNLRYPASLAEQERIALVLQTINYLIELQQKKYSQLCNMKTAMLEKMFPKDGADVPEIRFTGFTDPWERRELGELMLRVVRKNTNLESSLPLTISAEQGLVDQTTYFNSRVASKDLSNYYLVRNGEFAYNKSSSDNHPFGVVKRLDLYESGAVSTLYIVFAVKDECVTDSDFMTVLFETDRWHKGVSERAAEGARSHGLFNISPDDFFEVSVNVPKSKQEQVQLGVAFRQLDRLLALQQQKLEHLQNLKKALLDKMFV